MRMLAPMTTLERPSRPVADLSPPRAGRRWLLVAAVALVERAGAWVPAPVGRGVVRAQVLPRNPLFLMWAAALLAGLWQTRPRTGG